MAGPTYTYTPNVPQPAQGLNTTQNPILNNFQAINELISVNHVGFNLTNFGKHSLLKLEVQTVDPSTTSNEIAVYARTTGSPNPAEIFYRNPNNGTIVQLSGQTTPTSTGTSGSGYVTFPNGSIMHWGTLTFNTPSGSASTQTYNVTPGFKQYFRNAALTPVQPNGTWIAYAAQESTLTAVYFNSGTNIGSLTYNYLFFGF
jgi:hypothetical protein